jgi:hypothetical protein
VVERGDHDTNAHLPAAYAVHTLATINFVHVEPFGIRGRAENGIECGTSDDVLPLVQRGEEARLEGGGWPDPYWESNISKG